jgi:hypothetical protein
LNSSTVNGVTTTFLYDGDGTRVKKMAGTIPTIYPDQHYECTSGAACSRYVFAKDQRLALIDSAGLIHYYHPDHLGSSTVITKGSGTPTELGTKEQAYTYAPYRGVKSFVDCFSSVSRIATAPSTKLLSTKDLAPFLRTVS